jgi:hypothetical protein
LQDKDEKDAPIRELCIILEKMTVRKQHIPDIDFDRFAFGSIKTLFDKKEIYINYDYQRGDVWTNTQQN